MATPSSPDVQVNGAGPVLRSTDTCTIVGCPFTIGPTPHPCVTVQWQVTATSVQIGGDFALNEASVGLCLAPDQAPQGTVLITSTQAQASGV